MSTDEPKFMSEKDDAKGNLEDAVIRALHFGEVIGMEGEGD